MVHARSLAPLVKTRGFGMTPFKTGAKLTHYRSLDSALRLEEPIAMLRSG